MKIAVTGASGLLGWHTASRIHARNCTAKFRGERRPHELVMLDRAKFQNKELLARELRNVDAILHFAGVNRGEATEVEEGNPQIAQALVEACCAAHVKPHIVYANSTHAVNDTPYGRSKAAAKEILAKFSGRITDLVLPHIFGECARPNYNNVTATLIDQIWNDKEPAINPEGRVQLLHAGAAAQLAIESALAGTTGQISPAGYSMSIAELYQKLINFHSKYQDNIFPDLSDDFDLSLFNSYRAGAYPHRYPFSLKTNEDYRGCLFESAKGGNSSHTFHSLTLPGKRRGDHFHLNLVERFVVVSGDAVIRIRRILSDEVREFKVSGDIPVAIDQIPLHTHSIENIGTTNLITFFWSHRIFDPAHPDTYADPV